MDASKISDVKKSAMDVDLIINATLPQFNENIMEAALHAGVNYQDLSSNLKDLKHIEQLKFHKRFQKEHLIGLIDAGISPGITNLLAREGADKLDIVSSIKIRTLEDQKASEFVFAWSPVVALDELTSPPIVYRNRKFKLLRPFSDSEEYEFPAPFGKRTVGGNHSALHKGKKY